MNDPHHSSAVRNFRQSSSSQNFDHLYGNPLALREWAPVRAFIAPRTANFFDRDMTKDLIEASKFLSFVLRHQPDAIGISLDREGWADIASLIAAASAAGKRLDRALINTVVATSDKRRFALSDDGMRIRAVQGHSAESVDINFVEQVPPQFLYHGTATRFMESIRSEGLLPGSRRYLLLSHTEQTALAVGQRHGKPVVLKIEARCMYERGFKFYRAENGVWLTPRVPITFIGE